MVEMKKNSRILFIGALPPPVHGSAVVSQQIKESKIINEAFQCDWVNLSTSRRMDEIGKTTLAKPFRLIGALFREFGLLLTRHYDLCYLAITCHGAGFLKDSPFVLLCKLFRRKIIIHQHNKGMAKDIGSNPFRWLLPLCYKNAKVILLSWNLYSDIEKIVPKSNVFICPNGIKVGKSNIIKNNKNGEPRLLFLSNLIESKGVFVLLDALEILLDKRIHFRCDFVGGETTEIDSKRFAKEVNKRGLNHCVFYLGSKYGAEKDVEFENSDVFVFPSNDDCFPLVLLEAMKYHLPIITTNEGGIPDIVENNVNGLISKKQDANSLANCLELLISDYSLRKEMGESGNKLLLDKFTDIVFENRMHEILSKTIHNLTIE